MFHNKMTNSAAITLLSFPKFKIYHLYFVRISVQNITCFDRVLFSFASFIKMKGQKKSAPSSNLTNQIYAPI